MMMHRGLSVGLGVMVWGLFHLGMWGTPATAAPVTFQFAGKLTNVFGGALSAESFSVGQPFAGSYTFDPATLDGNSSANYGVYQAPTSLTATIGSYTVTSVPGGGHVVWIFDNYGVPPIDRYLLVSQMTGSGANGLETGQFHIELRDPSHTAFDSDALPSSPPSLSSFTVKRMGFNFSSGSHTLVGEIHSLTAVPVPAAVLLFGTGLTALIGLGAGTWRRKLTHLA